MERFASVSGGCLVAAMCCATIAVLVPSDANADARQKHLEKIGVIVNDGRGSGGGGGGGDGPGGGTDATDFPRMEVRGFRPNLPSIPTDLTGLMWSTSPTTSSTGRVSENVGAPEQETDAKDDCAGNPVILATGNKIEPELDFDSVGEMGLYLSRVYNKQWSGRGIFGRNWLSSFDYSLASQTVGNQSLLWLQTPDGRRLKFIWKSSKNRWEEDKAQAVAYITKATDGTYTHFNELNGSEKYSADGYIVERRNEQGISWKFHYTNKLLQRVVHSSGREVKFVWTGKQVTTVIAPNAHSFTYTYTPDVFGPGHGRLASATVPAAPAITTAYHYEDARFPDALTGKTINGQRYSWFTYHASGRAASTRHSGGAEKYTFTYEVLAEQSVLPPPAPPPPGGYGSGGSDRGWCEFVPGTGEICYNPMSMPPGEELQGQAATSQTGSTKPRASRMRVTTTNSLGRKTVHLFEDAKLVSVEGVTSPHCQARYKESEYDSNGYPNLVTDYKDGLTDFDYDAQGHLLKMIEAVGKLESRTTLFVWDVAKNRVTRETLVGEFQRDYLYNAQGRVTSVTVRNLSPNGVLNQPRVTTFTYTVHANGLLATVTEDGPLAGSADSTTRVYDSQGNLTALTNGLSHKVTYSGHDGLGLPARSVGTNGAITDYLYDGIGRLREVREHVNSAIASTGFDYDGSGLLVAVTTPDGHVRRTEYDAAHRPTMEFEQTDTGYDVRSYEYNAMSLPTVIRTGTSEYRPDTRIHGTIDGISESGGSPHVTGWACSLYFNPSINVHVYVGGPAGSGIYVASAVANKASESAVAQACQASGTAYRFSINLESMRAQHGGKLIHIHGISPVGRGNGQIGRSGQFRIPVVQTTPPTLPPDPECPPGQQCVPRIITPGDPQGDQFDALAIQGPYGTVETASYIDYDEEGRVRARRGNDGQHVRYVYDANDNVEYVIDSLNRSTHYEYDVLDRLVRTTDAKQGVTEMTYDRGDRVTSVGDARGNTTTYTWDGLGQLWSQNSPDTGVTAFGYNAAGQRTSLTRSDGSTLAFEYDTVGRLKKASAGLESRAYWYDNCLPNSPHTGRGQLCRIDTTDAGGALKTHTIFYYSPHGQLTARHDTGSGANDVTRYGYDLMGRPTSITYPSGAIARYAYHRGKVRSLTVEPVAGTVVNVTTGIEHQPFGGIKGWTYGNGLKRLQGYDLDGRLNALSVTGGAMVRQSLTYAWTANDQIEAVTNGVDATQSHRYKYDELGRLVGDFIGGATVGNRDGFDAGGNRTSRGSTIPGTPPSSTYAISPMSNRMDSQSGNANRLFGYSPTGQLTSSSGWQGHRAYYYDAFDRLESANAGGAVTQYVVNALDQRMTKTGPLGSYRYVYAGQNTLLGEHGASGWKNYLYLAGAPVAVVTPGNDVHFIHTDHLGRPESATRANKAKSWSAVNLSYHRTVAMDTIGGISLGFPGQTWDEETGTWHNGFRDYDPHLGRYIQSDPIGLAGGMNTYVYAGSNPVNYVDPFGLEACSAIEKLGRWAKDRGSTSFTFNAGAVAGISGRITVDSKGISGSFGLGLGIGVGVSATGDVNFGKASGWYVGAGASGGGVVGAQSAANIGFNGSSQVSSGGGLGVGAGTTMTVGYAGDIYSFEKFQNSDGQNKCGCD